ncbi:hypothetical protein JF544_16485 [Halobacillus kuroshimensis]|uniref:Uncharacterized protein n=1 Tax=Halobacillus kuroshimensis TaxID=302481 RepID=A0ABS3DZS4_9BACI|nr:hypothetical protein [Halobacillus kuroshimensis]MBN8236857.1 hypothetical protein [Halobacillus kuroshimensis]
MIKNSEAFDEVTDQAMRRENSNDFYAGFIGKLQWAMRNAERNNRESISLDKLQSLQKKWKPKHKNSHLDGSPDDYKD